MVVSCEMAQKSTRKRLTKVGEHFGKHQKVEKAENNTRGEAKNYLQEFVKLVLRLRFRGRVSVFPPVSTSCNQGYAIVQKPNRHDDEEDEGDNNNNNNN